MEYNKTIWKARKGENLNKFTKSRETAMSVILTNFPDQITDPGTPFSEENMNHIEEGIEAAHLEIKKANDEILSTQKIVEKANAEILTMQETIAETDRAVEKANEDILATQEAVKKANAEILSTQEAIEKTDKAVEKANEDILATQVAIANKTVATNNTLIGKGTSEEPLGINQDAFGEFDILNSPEFTGTPKVPIKTSAATSDGTLIATEAQVALKANLESPEFTGTPKVPTKTSAATSDGTLIATEAQVEQKQNKLNRTVGGNDNATGTVTDSGGNLSIPIPVTVTAPVSSATQSTAGTRALRAELKIYRDNIANLFANKANLDSPVFTGSPKITDSESGSTNRIAVVAETTARDETNLPVGVSVYVGVSLWQIGRNKAEVIYLGGDINHYSITGTRALAGTWLSSGTNSSAHPSYGVFRRTL